MFIIIVCSSVHKLCNLGKNVYTLLKLSTTGQNIPLIFLLANLILKLHTVAKSIRLLVWC